MMRRESVLLVGRILSTGFLSVALSVPASSAQERAAEWPRSHDALVFLFATAFDPILAYSADSEEPVFNYSLEPRGRARVSSSGALELGRGGFTALGVGESLRRAFAESPSRAAMTLELFLRPVSPSQSTRETFLELGASPPLLSLSQEGRRVVLGLPATGPESRIELRASLAEGKGHHLALTLDSQGVALFIDGRRSDRQKTDPLESSFGAAGLDHLVLGSGSPSIDGWGGRLEGIALYSRILDADEIRENAVAYARLVNLREPIQAVTLSGRLLRKSHVPTLEELAPYRRSLAVFEYEVLSVSEGFYLLDEIRVAHWVILDREPLQVGETPPGAVIELTVEPFAENRQLENVNISDTLPLDFELDLFFSVGTSN